MYGATGGIKDSLRTDYQVSFVDDCSPINRLYNGARTDSNTGRTMAILKIDYERCYVGDWNLHSKPYSGEFWSSTSLGKLALKVN